MGTGAGAGGGDAGRLTVAVGADTSDLDRALNQGAQSVRNFANTTQQGVASVGQIAQALDTLGLASGATVNRLGQIVVAERDIGNATSFVGRFAGEIQVVSREATAAAQATQRLARETSNLANATREAAAATAGSIGGGGVARLGSVIDETTGRFTALGRKGAQTFLALDFAAEQFAEGSEGGLRRAARSLASFGVFLGPEGAIVSGFALASLAAVDFYEKSEKAARKAREEFQSTVDELVRTGNQLGIITKLQQLQVGDPAKGLGQGGGFTGGIRDLTARLQQAGAEVENLQRQARGMDGAFASAKGIGEVVDSPRLVDAKTKYADLATQLNSLTDQYHKLETVARNPITLPVAPQGLPVQDVTADSLGKTARLAEQAADRRQRAAQRAANAEIESLTRVAEAGDAAALAISGDRLADSLGVGSREGSARLSAALTRGIEELVKVVNAQQATNDLLVPVAVVAKLQTTREELEQQIRAALPPDNVFDIHLEAQVKQIALDLKNTSVGSTIGSATNPVNPYLIGAFADPRLTPERFARQTQDSFAIVARDAQQVEQAFARLPGLAESFGGRLLSTVSAGAGGLASIGGGVTSIKNGLGAVDTLTGVASIASGVLSVGGAVLSLGQYLSAETQEQRLARQAIASNTSALVSLSAKYDAASGTAARQATVLGVVNSAITAGGGNSSIPGQLATTQALLGALASAGLSLAQFQAAAQELGITIVTENGKIVANSIGTELGQLRDALQLTTANIFKFSDTIEGTTHAAEIRDTLLGKTGAQDDLARQLAVFTNPKFTSAGIASLFAGVDPNSAGGREAIKRGLLNLLDRAQAGTLKPEDLPGFHSLDEFLSVVGTAASDLNSLGDATKKATDAMLNVPTGFRIALATFAAQDPTTVGGGGGTFPTGGGDPGTLTSGGPWGGMHQIPTGKTPPTSVTYVFQLGSGAIVTQAKNGAQLLDEMIAGAGERARSQTGASRTVLQTLGRAPTWSR